MDRFMITDAYCSFDILIRTPTVNKFNLLAADTDMYSTCRQLTRAARAANSSRVSSSIIDSSTTAIDDGSVHQLQLERKYGYTRHMPEQVGNSNQGHLTFAVCATCQTANTASAI
jgi:hypothetical protein